jgi:hypothetical protein
MTISLVGRALRLHIGRRQVFVCRGRGWRVRRVCWGDGGRRHWTWQVGPVLVVGMPEGRG